MFGNNLIYTINMGYQIYNILSEFPVVVNKTGIFFSFQY